MSRTAIVYQLPPAISQWVILFLQSVLLAAWLDLFICWQGSWERQSDAEDHTVEMESFNCIIWLGGPHHSLTLALHYGRAYCHHCGRILMIIRPHHKQHHTADSSDTFLWRIRSVDWDIKQTFMIITSQHLIHSKYNTVTQYWQH